MSMDTATILVFIETLSTRIENQEMFTCFDITRLLRDRGCTVDHQDVRDLVHSLAGTNLPPFRDSGYVRNSYTPIAGYNANAEVYAHNSQNASAYDPEALNPASTAVTPATSANVAAQPVNQPVVTTGTPVAQVKTATKVTRPKATSVSTKTALDSKRMLTSRDNRGRVSIHNGFVKSLGLTPGSFVYVSKRAGGDGLVVLNKASKSGHLQTYRVDRSGNVRISRKVLEDAGLNRANNFKMRLRDDNQAVILVQN